MEKLLTIVIPTYNRKERLARTLKLLENQTCGNFNLVILDNNSNYKVSDLLKNYSENFLRKIELVSNKVNIGMVGNICNSFLHAKTKWLWILADDDIVHSTAVEIIYDSIVNNNSYILHFSPYDENDENDLDQKIYTLPEYIEFFNKHGNNRSNYYKMKNYSIFLSSYVFNMDKCSQYVHYAFEYSYTNIPSLVVILKILDDQKGYLQWFNKKFIDYDRANGDQWNTSEVTLGLRTISDISFSLTKKLKKDLVRIMMFSFDKAIYFSLGAKNQKEFLKKLYNDVYKYTLKIHEKIIYKFAVLLSNWSNFFSNILIFLRKYF